MVNNMPSTTKVWRIRDNGAILAGRGRRPPQGHRGRAGKPAGGRASWPPAPGPRGPWGGSGELPADQLRTDRTHDRPGGLIKSSPHLGLTESQEEALNRLAGNNIPAHDETRIRTSASSPNWEAVALTLGGLVET